MNIFTLFFFLNHVLLEATYPKQKCTNTAIASSQCRMWTHSAVDIPGLEDGVSGLWNTVLRDTGAHCPIATLVKRSVFLNRATLSSLCWFMHLFNQPSVLFCFFSLYVYIFPNSYRVFKTEMLI